MKKFMSILLLSVLMMGTVSTMRANAESSEQSSAFTIMMSQMMAFSTIFPYTITSKSVHRTSPLREQSSMYFDLLY